MSQHGAGEDVKKPAPQDTQTRSRLLIGQNGPSDSALLGACARACVPRRYTPSGRAHPRVCHLNHAEQRQAQERGIQCSRAIRLDKDPKVCIETVALHALYDSVALVLPDGEILGAISP